MPTFLLVDVDGNDLGTFRVSQTVWHPGDVIPRGRDQQLRVVNVIDTQLDGDYDTALVVEPVESELL